MACGKVEFLNETHYLYNYNTGTNDYQLRFGELMKAVN